MDSSWTENDSALYRDLQQVAVPERRAQLATLLTLLPFPPDARAEILELGCGTGALSYAILHAFPGCHVLALDGSTSMLDRTREHLARFGPRLRLEPFALEKDDWREHMSGKDAVLSSLAIHHLDGNAKRRLYAQAGRAVSSGGALLIADLVEPQRDEAQELFRATWDESVAASGSRELTKRFHDEEWNIYRYPDPADQPSPLFHQLQWMKDAGFAVVDCYWLQAGHAIYGGYRSRDSTGQGLPYARALEIADEALARTR